MKKKNQTSDFDDDDRMNGSKSNIDIQKKKKKKRNTMRLGGASGLSLEAFTKAKSNNKSNHFNPSLIKKQREFYKNAKHVSKFKKKLKQQNQPNDHSSNVRPQQLILEGENDNVEGSKMIRKNKKHKSSLNELYEKQCEEEEKARIEREAIIKAKREEREKAETHRKAAREKMFKRTRHGQPVMKYRIEHLLQSVQGASNDSRIIRACALDAFPF